jgi:hypothetical protein
MTIKARVIETYEQYYKIALKSVEGNYYYAARLKPANSLGNDCKDKWFELEVDRSVQAIKGKQTILYQHISTLSSNFESNQFVNHKVYAVIVKDGKVFLLRNMNSEAFIQVKYQLQYLGPLLQESNVRSLTKRIGNWHRKELEGVINWNPLIVPGKPKQYAWNCSKEVKEGLQAAARQEKSRRRQSDQDVYWWRLPGGDIEWGDKSPLDAVFREMAEEINRKGTWDPKVSSYTWKDETKLIETTIFIFSLSPTNQLENIYIEEHQDSEFDDH